MKQAPVVLADYDPIWPQEFEREKRLLLRIAGEFLTGTVEHVGSTAVPGLIAKPVIDIMFGVRSLTDSTPAIDLLEANGYEYADYKTDVMHWLCKPSQEYRTHHLHLVPYLSDLWRQRIRFRDLLRADERLASEYAELKRSLAEMYKEDREAYTLAKWPFIQRALR
ncbi:MAG TPA: GrpB family protein [Gammaproteobacteria bacterium]|nr:GrpB family protein [Gammaproteobacteria bacterium]